jgi:PAS domain S-box-containing protein
MKDHRIRETEQALRDSDLRFRTLVDQASDAFFLHDAKGKFIDVNRKACESLGYTRDELLRLTVTDVDRDFNLTSARKIWELTPPGEAVTVQGHHRRKDGTLFPVEARLSSCEIDGQRLYLGLVRDISDRERADLALRHSEGQYRILFNSIDEGFCFIELLYDDDGNATDYRFLEVNPAFQKHVGLQNAAGHTIRELAPDIEHKWIATYAQVAASGQPIRFTEESPSLDRWFDVYAFPVEGIGRNKVAIVFTNVTDRKRGEEALRESERRITDFANTIPTLAWMANADGYITWYNQRWFQYTGTTPQQMEGWGWQLVHDPTTLPVVMNRWIRSIRTGEPFEMEFPLRGADGKLRSFLTRVVPVRNSKGEIIQWFGTNTDVEELRRTREDLVRAQERIRIAMRSTPLLLYTVDRDLRYTWMPGSHPGFHAPDAIGHRGEEFLEPSFAQALVEFKLSVLASGTSDRREFHTTRNGKTVVWDITAEPIRDDSEAVSGLTIAALDVTDRVRADEALRKSEKLALVGRLAATISHEIRNPLDAVGNLLYIMESEDDVQTLREFARNAREELARVEHIVTHTLQFNRHSETLTEDRLSDLLESSVTIYKGRIKLSGVMLARKYDPSDRIFCFSSELRQVFANLLGNAFDATPRGGTVYLRTRSRTHRRTGEPGVTVTVADTGIGMTRKTLQRLFEPFFTTKGLEGTGIGLWVSREILDKHDARVRVKSRHGSTGSGAVFSLWFPRTFSVAAPASASRDSQSAETSKSAPTSPGLAAQAPLSP